MWMRGMSLGIAGIAYVFGLNQSFLKRIRDRLFWCPTSALLLEQAEEKLLSYLKTPYEVDFVPVVHSDEKKEQQIRSIHFKYNINTCTSKEKEDNIPIVLLHGFASGIGLWILNFDVLSQDRPVYALDILGFGRSARPSFSKDPEIAENQLVESIEQWRKNLGLQQFILLGHSMGGFLASSYTLRYPDQVKHLILADPWGFPPPNTNTKTITIPMWAKVLAAMLRPFNPLAALRAAGPWGPNLVKRLRPDILHKFENVVSDPSEVASYIYHCNAQTPSGEAAFKAMTGQFGWAKRPMLERISTLRNDVGITFIYGSRSWIDSASGSQTAAIRLNSYVKTKVIQGAGHHVYADKADEFNESVALICKNIDISSH